MQTGLQLCPISAFQCITLRTSPHAMYISAAALKSLTISAQTACRLTSSLPSIPDDELAAKALASSHLRRSVNMLMAFSTEPAVRKGRKCKGRRARQLNENAEGVRI